MHLADQPIGLCRHACGGVLGAATAPFRITSQRHTCHRRHGCRREHHHPSLAPVCRQVAGERQQTEAVLCFKKGRIPKPRGSRKERQIVVSKRTKHSEKPQEVYDRIERMFPTQNKIEMFARKVRLGWSVWGNEI